MNHTLQAPTTVVIGQGAINVQFLSSGTLWQDDDYCWVWNTYTFTAVPAAGWGFKQFNILSERKYKNDSSNWVETSYTYSRTVLTNPVTTTGSDVPGPTALKIFDMEGYPLTVLGYDYQDKWTISATFELSAVLGDQLVYDDNSNQLIYDDASNRLIYAG